MKENVKYYMVRQKAIPEVLLKVVEAKGLLESEKVETIQDAVDAVGIRGNGSAGVPSTSIRTISLNSMTTPGGRPLP